MSRAALAVLTLFSGLGQAVARGQEAPAPRIDCAGMSAVARSGDLVFRAEAGVVSRMVMHAQRDERYSHVGVVVVNGGLPSVFHAEMDTEAGTNGVVSQDFCAYLRRAVRASLMRPTALKGPDRDAIVDAVAALGHRSFNWRLSWQPADGSVYCTQYVWRVFERALPGRLPGLSADAVLTVPQLLGSMSLAAVRSLDASTRLKDPR